MESCAIIANVRDLTNDNNIGSMVDLREGIIDAVGQGLCNITTGSGLLAQLGSSLWRRAGADGIANAGQDLANGFGAASDLFCNRPPRDISGEGAPLFTGGQCPGTTYNVEWNVDFQTTNCTTGDVQNNPGVVSDGNVVGPLTNPRVVEIGGGCDGGPSGYRLEMDTGLGLRAPVAVQTNFPGQVFASNLSINSVTVTAVSGPDDCGSLPNEPPAFDPGQFNPTLPINYEDNSGNPQTINVPVQYGPGDINNNNEFEVPFTLNFAPNVNIDGSLNLNTGDINIGTGGGGTAPNEIPEDEPIPEGAALVGVRVVFTQAEAEKTPATERLYGSASQAIWLPRLAAVRFEYEADNLVGWGPTRFAQTLDSIIWAERPALNYELLIEGDVEFTVTKLVMTPALFFNGASGPGS